VVAGIEGVSTASPEKDEETPPESARAPGARASRATAQATARLAAIRRVLAFSAADRPGKVT
jgi:hypothetical protein